MNINAILFSIDTEIARLQQARSLLAGMQGGTTSAPAKKVAKRRKLSAAARKRIADTQRKRWAKVKAEKAAKLAPAKKAGKKKAPAKKAVAKKTPAKKATKAVSKKVAPASAGTAPF